MSDFLEVMHEYFRGERLAGAAIIATGIGLCGFAVYVWRTQEGGFVWGLALPLAIVGVMAATVGPFFIAHNGRLADEIARRYEADASTLVAEESARMTRVNANWPRLKIGWAVIGLVAMALILFVKQDWSSGLGLALIVLVAILFAVDVFGERRAVPYTEALSALARGPDPS
ncbi:MAG: hypothetical protein KF729_09340 [Sandaracinaceae bacterium]|nr:hypothetical protein [Sandaracinaceae bacterium]